MKLKEVKYYVKSRPKELRKSTMHFGRPLIKRYTSADSRNKWLAYIVWKTNDIHPKVCGRVKIGLFGKRIPFAGTDPDDWVLCKWRSSLQRKTYQTAGVCQLLNHNWWIDWNGIVVLVVDVILRLWFPPGSSLVNILADDNGRLLAL